MSSYQALQHDVQIAQHQLDLCAKTQATIVNRSRGSGIQVTYSAATATLHCCYLNHSGIRFLSFLCIQCSVLFSLHTVLFSECLNAAFCRLLCFILSTETSQVWLCHILWTRCWMLSLQRQLRGACRQLYLVSGRTMASSQAL